MKPIRISVDNIFTTVPLLAFIFFAINIDTFLGSRRWNPYWFQIIAFCLAFLAYTIICVQSKFITFKSLFINPLSKWLLLILFLSFISLTYSKDLFYAGLGFTYLLSTVIIVLSCLISFRYLLLRENTDYGFSFLCVLTIACLSIILDPIYDFRILIAPDLEGMYERTRGSGLFLQPNVAGAAIALLYALVIPRVSGNLAFIATIVAFLAILLTFSRSGMAVFIIIFIFGIWCKYLPRYTLPVITILILFLLATTSVLYFISDVFNIDQGSGFNRLFNTSEFLGSDAFVSGDRFYILLDALGLYFESAILGNGIGYSWYFAESNLFQQGTHNLYLRYMLEYGTIGLFIWPLFLYALYRIRHKGVGTKWAIGVSISAMAAALFSHNIPEQGVILAPLMACFLFPIKPVNR